MSLKDQIKKNDFIYFSLKKSLFFLKYTVPNAAFREKYAEYVIKKRFRQTFGREINLESPTTLNEKLQWLKLNIHEDFHTQCADKYKARDVWRKYGEDGLIPLLFKTYDYRDITIESIPDEPCIIKANTGCGSYHIIRDKSDINIKSIQRECRSWLVGNYYYVSQEWQYKNIKPCILIEKLLLDANGKIPNDYKFNFINGELQFIYCSVDREGQNYRSIYGPDWKRLNIEWVGKNNHKGTLVGADIQPPHNLDRMIEIGKDIAKRFCYVRVDFYEVDKRLYYGEITLHHGSGFDTFEPEEYDYIYGEKLKLPVNKGNH
ncbi:MAG: glycosyl transferase [Lachnospiraceae bacterium]|jgi:hypothetical protein|nr:glycosyl transferase [Lachnospiraceae bacterium]